MDSNDRELLELAAKAAGVEVMPMSVQGVKHRGDDQFIGLMVDPNQWSRGWFNPLEDDGDALRLAVRLAMCLDLAQEGDDTFDHFELQVKAIYHDKDDPYAASRRAIVLAAAEIGRQSDD